MALHLVIKTCRVSRVDNCFHNSQTSQRTARKVSFHLLQEFPQVVVQSLEHTAGEKRKRKLN